MIFENDQPVNYHLNYVNLSLLQIYINALQLYKSRFAIFQFYLIIIY